MRAIWTGHITFGLISIPVGLHAAIEASERVSFRLLHKKDMAPIRYKKFCSEEDIEVPNDEIVKGYEVSRKKYAVVEKEEFEEVQKSVGEGDRSIDVLQFVDLGSLNPLSFEKPYYVSPQKGGEKAYAVLRDALAEARRVGIARFFLRTRPLLAALIPGPEAMALEVLRSFEELRDPSKLGAPASAKRPAEVKMARMLIDQMSEQWDPTQHPNEYSRALKKLLASKRKFAIAPEAKRGGKEAEVVDLMEALKRSIGEKGGRAKARKSGVRRAGAA